jgi:aldose 1-epimerase
MACSSPKSAVDVPKESPQAPTPSEAAPSAANTASSSEPSAEAAITDAPFGEIDGQKVTLYTLKNKGGLTLKVTNYGAIITEFHVPDKGGKLADVVLGFNTLEEYTKGSPYFGATVGRVANRIKNGKFELAGKKYTLAQNAGEHHLHGGVKGWDKVVWNAEPATTEAGPSVTFTYLSKAGEEGYPGTVNAKSVYTLTHDNELRVEMTATTDAPTLVNMVHHTYWNLGGFDSGTIQDHELTLFAQSYTPGGKSLVPDGTVKPVKGTPFDFTSPKLIGKDLQAAGGEPIGFDHNWIVEGEPGALRKVAVLSHPGSGRVLSIEADKPGVQFYSGNFLDGSLVGKGAKYPQYSGLCLETQNHPNSVNVKAWKDAVVLEPGETYSHTMIHRFTAQ